MKKLLRHYVLLMIVVITSSIILQGCGGKKVIFTTGLGDDDVFSIDREKCTYSEAMVVLTNIKNQYEVMFEDDLWHKEFKGKTLEEYVKDETIQKISRVICLDLLAESKEIELTDEEKTLAQSAANEYYESLNGTEIEYMDIDVDTLTKMYEDYALANKTYDEITKDVIEEVSDAQARIATVQQIYFPFDEDNKESVEKAAEKVLDKANDGSDFESLAEDNNPDDVSVKITFSREDMPEEFVNAAFELEDDEISDLVETADGYYIIKCIKGLERELTDENKETIITESKETAFHEMYDEFISGVASEFNNDLWDSIELKKEDNVTTTGFFDVYDKCFSE